MSVPVLKYNSENLKLFSKRESCNYHSQFSSRYPFFLKFDKNQSSILKISLCTFLGRATATHFTCCWAKYNKITAKLGTVASHQLNCYKGQPNYSWKRKTNIWNFFNSIETKNNFVNPKKKELRLFEPIHQLSTVFSYFKNINFTFIFMTLVVLNNKLNFSYMIPLITGIQSYLRTWYSYNFFPVQSSTHLFDNILLLLIKYRKSYQVYNYTLRNLSIYILIKLWSPWLYDCLFVCLRPCVRILDTEWLL